MSSSRHRWGERVELGLHKSEKQCTRCGIIRASLHQQEGGRDRHWKEFFHGLDRVDVNGATPPCDARLEPRHAGELEVAL